MKRKFYWVEFNGETIVAERVIDKDDGIDFWHLTGSTDTIYDDDVTVLNEVERT